jgi:mono/diheme cytochrome c family protein
MRKTARRVVVSMVGLLMGFSVVSGQDVEAGKAVYDKWCVECHGIDGLGDGSAAISMLPRPRDFSQARYQIRTTGSGQLPTDDDLKLVIQEGLPGTTMPGWPNLSNSETNDVIAYVKSLSRFFGQGDPPRALDFGSDPGGGSDAVEAGAQAYLALECEACHGASGRGEGTSAPTLEDWRGFPVRAADLTEGWYLNGGGSVEDIHARVLTGLDGTPMPAASDAMNAGVVSPDEVWQLAHYIADLGLAEMPTLRDVVRVTRVEGSLPTDGSEAAWEGVDTFYFPLAGQVIQPPRNFAPTIDGVYVQGLHDGVDIALRVQWHDPSNSPDPAWDEWQVKFMNALDLDGDSLVVDSLEAPLVRPPDAFTVQFPFEVPEGTEKPYFLMGDARNPVYLWTWNGELGVRAARGRGLESVEELGEDPVTGSAIWDAGRWTLYLRRAVSMEGDGLSFEEGTVIPVAFLAWDGSSGEVGKRSSVSSWYYMLLDKPPSSTVVVIPLIAILLTGALGLVLVRRAQDRERE